METRIALQTDQGPRSRNEDQGIAIQADIGGRRVALLGVCDGIGGVAHGLEAARLTAKELHRCLSHFDHDVIGDGEAQVDNGAIRSIVDRWARFAANQLLRHRELGDFLNQTGLATTVVAAVMSGQTLVVWWLGDSRAYRFWEGQLEQLTTDHSVVAERGLTEEEALVDPNRNKITKFLGPDSRWSPDVVIKDWQDGDVVLLVSDGVCGSLTSWELEAFLAYWLTSDIAPEALARLLLEYIKPNQTDNATVAVATRGTPKPLGDHVPTVTFESLRRHGLARDLLQAITARPTSSSQWKAREVPPWREVRSNGRPILNRDPRWEQRSGPRKICSECGSWISDETKCEDHPELEPYQGPFLEVWSPDGLLIRRQPLRGATTAGAQSKGSPEGLILDDDAVAPNHLKIEIQSSDAVEIADERTDAGVWLRATDVKLSEEWLHDGIELLVGHHHIIVGTTESGGRPTYKEALLIERIATSERLNHETVVDMPEPGYPSVLRDGEAPIRLTNDGVPSPPQESSTKEDGEG